MKTYTGSRTIDGLVVTVDGVPLSDHRTVKTYTDTGFEWGYPGDSPRQLALAILFDHLGVASDAIAAADAFMKKVVAVLDNDWVLTSEQVDAALESINST
ncbi:MAG: DUF6166 domain-containing protein [Rhodospirillales bacterium]